MTQDITKFHVQSAQLSAEQFYAMYQHGLQGDSPWPVEFHNNVMEFAEAYARAAAPQTRLISACKKLLRLHATADFYDDLDNKELWNELREAVGESQPESVRLVGTRQPTEEEIRRGLELEPLAQEALARNKLRVGESPAAAPAAPLCRICGMEVFQSLHRLGNQFYDHEFASAECPLRPAESNNF